MMFSSDVDSEAMLNISTFVVRAALVSRETIPSPETLTGLKTRDQGKIALTRETATATSKL
jgi:hypothetical protein